MSSGAVIGIALIVFLGAALLWTTKSPYRGRPPGPPIPPGGYTPHCACGRWQTAGAVYHQGIIHTTNKCIKEKTR